MRSILLLVVLFALLLASCSDTAEDPEEAGDEDTSPVTASSSPTPTPTGIEVETWVGDALPPAAGGMARHGELGIYFGEVDHQYTLVAVDITSGTELWRQRVHQLGRIPGTVPTPVVDRDRGLVFATRYEPDHDPPLLGLFAYDLDGQEQWRSGVNDFARSTQLCAEEFVCASMPDGSIQVIVRESGGTRVSSGRGGVGRVLGSFDPWLITANAERRLLELGRIDPGGAYQQQWQRSFSELFGDERAGATYTPNGGWYSNHNDDTGMTGIAFGTFLGEARDAKALREEAELGLAVSLVDDDGEVRASWQRVDLCLSSDAWRGETVVLCEDLEVVDDGRIVDDQPAPYFQATRVSSYRMADGEQQWTTALPGPVDSVMPTSDESLFLVNPEDDDSLVLNVDDGSIAALAETPELIVACEPDFEHGVHRAELETADGDLVDYARARNLYQLCDASGQVVDPAELLATGEPAPSWFGYRPHLNDEEEPQGADRWAVWITPEGTFHGAGPADPAR